MLLNIQTRRTGRRIARYSSLMKIVYELIKDIPETPGWYVWFNSEDKSPIYVGQASEGKTCSLKTRLYDELVEELVAVWSRVNKRAVEIYTAKYNGKYNQVRAAKKQDADTILWISYPRANLATLDVTETKLIWCMFPKANERAKNDGEYLDADWSAYDKCLQRIEPHCRLRNLRYV